MPIEVSDVRRRLRGVIESARKRAQERRASADRAALEFEDFLRHRVIPTVQIVASALVAEGYRFKMHTPAGSVRLASEVNAEDFIDIVLDTTADPPAVVGRTSRGRGRRLIASERALREDASIAQLTEEDVLAFLMTELAAFVER